MRVGDVMVVIFVYYYAQRMWIVTFLYSHHSLESKFRKTGRGFVFRLPRMGLLLLI